MARHDIPAVVTAMNVNGLGVARVLGRHGVPVIGIHENSTDPETKTRFLDELWVRSPGRERLVELLLERGPDFRESPVLLPITDDAVTAIALRQSELREHYRISMPDTPSVLQLLDKKGFHEVAERLDMPVPGTWFVDGSDSLERIAADLVFPCIMKPQEKTDAYAHAGGKKAYVLDNFPDLRAAYAVFSSAEPRVVIQQFIPGGDDAVFFCLQACGEDHAPILSFTGRKLRQWRPQCGGTSAAEPAHEPRLAEQTAEFFRATNMLGPCSMEFKRDPRSGAFFMIEPTVCRTDWQNGLADANGHPMAYAAYCSALGLPLPPARNRWFEFRWVLFGADRLSAHHYRRKGELSLVGWLWSIRPLVRGAYFALDDPRPYLAIAVTTARSLLRKVGRVLGFGNQEPNTA